MNFPQEFLSITAPRNPGHFSRSFEASNVSMETRGDGRWFVGPATPVQRWLIWRVVTCRAMPGHAGPCRVSVQHMEVTIRATSWSLGRPMPPAETLVVPRMCGIAALRRKTIEHVVFEFLWLSGHTLLGRLRSNVDPFWSLKRNSSSPMFTKHFPGYFNIFPISNASMKNLQQITLNWAWAKLQESPWQLLCP